jgi:hypothetical protein
VTLVSQAEYQAALRADFYSFMLRCFAELNPGASFLPSWHIEVVAAKLQVISRWPDTAAHHQHPTSPLEVARGFDRIARLAARP